MDEKLWKEKIEKGFHLMYQKALSFGGLVSGEHGIGYAKKILHERFTWRKTT